MCVCVYGSYEAHVGDSVEQHESVQEVKSAIHQPPFCTLDDCFQLYTRDERVLYTLNRNHILVVIAAAAAAMVVQYDTIRDAILTCTQKLT